MTEHPEREVGHQHQGWEDDHEMFWVLAEDGRAPVRGCYLCWFDWWAKHDQAGDRRVARTDTPTATGEVITVDTAFIGLNTGDQSDEHHHPKTFETMVMNGDLPTVGRS